MRFNRLVLIILCCAAVFFAYADETVVMKSDYVIEAFDARGVPASISVEGAEVRSVRRAGGRALRVRFDGAETGASVTLAAGDGAHWDCTGFAGIAVDVTNPGDLPAEVTLAARSKRTGETSRTVKISGPAVPGKTETLRLYFDNNGAGPYWGMRGIPVYGPVNAFGDRLAGEPIEPGRIGAFVVSVRDPGKRHTLIIDNLRAFRPDSPLARLVPHPFIDTFGQFIHADWPGKVMLESELRARGDAERAALDAAPVVPSRDRFGGWADGPQLPATGWFRTERVDGKWWLVTPEGRLFFSIGINCIYPGDQTFIEGRDDWFADLPSGEPFAPFFGSRSGVHSMAGPIGGRGRTFNFYSANLLRKYGNDWRDVWRDTAYARLRTWGFNTIGNWAVGDVLAHTPLPFTVNLSNSGVPPVAGAVGFWGNMMDVYDPAFETSAEAVGRSAAQYAGNPMVVGFFVDNELSWEKVGVGTLDSPPTQPARIAFIEMLKTRYPDIASLNAAWAATNADWDALRAPSSINPACKRDLDAFVYAFAHRCFQTVKDALRQHAPNHLYLGCRFARTADAAARACADVVDVVSFNLYRDLIRCEDWTGSRDLGKPVIIGEFHFGATDRGMFHTGLRRAASQADRAACYRRYVESVAACPAFVGCHWFQYKDQPTTGRDLDGENFSIGFVSITDTPYPELGETARDLHAGLYSFRFDAR